MSKYKEIFEYLISLFPDAETELHYTTSFQLLVAVMLSAQTTDKQVNKVTEKLFFRLKEPDDVIQRSLEDLTKSISSVNLYKTKAKHIRETAKILEAWWSLIPQTENELIKLPGVWVKTAKVILHILYKRPVIAVDTHVHRVCNRLWIVNTKMAEQTSKLLEKRIPKEYKPIAHHSLILFWRYICKAQKPICNECKLQHLCKRYKLNKF